MTREDRLAKTIRPRLDSQWRGRAAGLSQCQLVGRSGQEQTFTLKHLPLLEAELERLKPRLVVLDPIQSFFGDCDMTAPTRRGPCSMPSPP